jgi:6-phosphogluconolactonase
MIDRRSFAALVAGVIAMPRSALSQMTSSKTVFYASVGPALTLYQIDVDDAGLTRQGTIVLPGNVQYVWRHPSAPLLYAATSNGGSSSLGIKGDSHFLSALRIDPGSGALTTHGPPAALAARPIHLSLDRTGAYALVAYNSPSGVTVHRIAADGTVGEQVKQAAAPLDGGIFAHQIRTTPANDAAILVTRGNDAAGSKPEDPGALKLFSFKDGQLTNRGSIAPNGGYGFGPRHLDPRAIFSKATLAESSHIRSRQAASTVHVHPDGRHVYVGNRASDTVDFGGKQVFPGGENNIAVFAIDPSSGEPTLIQNADVHGIHPRTFALDPSGRMLVVANLQTMLVRDGDGVKTVPANLATFHVGPDGKLAFAHNYQVDTGEAMQFWSGMVALG